MIQIELSRVRAVLNAQCAEDLYGPLQGAIELEHSTVPVYLTALYSIKDGAMPAVRGILRSIVKEEMLHMTIACNVLNAIGGLPAIDVPAFVPTYPGPLPMSINPSLKVHLGPLSMDRVKNEFMMIEEPETPLDFPIRSLFAAEAAPSFATIGQFYAALITRINEFGDTIFIKDHSRQVTDTDFFPAEELFAITDAALAVSGLNIIVQQGEGTSTTPLGPEGQIAHFYRFEQITKGLVLTPDPSAPQGFSFGPAKVPFDSTGIYDMVMDPKSATYKPGSPARMLSDRFNQAYTNLLQNLHQTFNGSPSMIDDTIHFMKNDLDSQARSLVQTIDDVTGKNATPTFEYNAG